ncbi:MAG: zinc metalloprotease [Nocardioidaceae bacterium]|nr:zinc metalloprotease [Nocardioidaceae bacterium]
MTPLCPRSLAAVGAAMLALSLFAVPADAMRLDEPAPGGSAPQRCIDAQAQDSGARAATNGRQPDHRDLTVEEKQAIEQRADRILREKRFSSYDAGTLSVDVPVYVHVMLSESGEGNVSREQILDQFAALNAHFGGQASPEAAVTGFTFTLKGVKRYYNDTWHTGGESVRYRSLTRVGGAGTLNMWLVDMGGLGIATFPSDYDAAPKKDGIRVHYASLPGGSIENYNLGGTATHEAGHWLGLYHTFDGGCSRPNDQVGDTPAQRFPTDGCPEGQDTCPGRRGLDPIHNYMDYSYDRCYNQFTGGQSARMANMWTAFRADDGRF